MVANKRSLFLLKVSEDANGGDYKTIAGLEAVSFNLNSQIIDSSNLASGQWQELLDEAGIKSVSILASGIFKNSAEEKFVREAAFAGDAKYFQLQFNNGDKLEAEFVIANYERRGTIEDEEIYSFTLSSKGAVNYSKVS